MTTCRYCKEQTPMPNMNICKKCFLEQARKSLAEDMLRLRENAKAAGYGDDVGAYLDRHD